MKKRIVFLLILVFSINISKAQKNSCPLEIYKLVFEEANLYKNKAVEIEIGYKPSKYITSSIVSMNMFNETEINQFNNIPDNIDYSHCSDLKKEVESLLSDDSIGKNGSYMRFLFSSVISF